MPKCINKKLIESLCDKSHIQDHLDIDILLFIMDKSQRLRDGVLKAYSEAADNPLHEHPFPVGLHFAEELGYPQDLLLSIPTVSVEVFSGVSNVSLFASIPPGATVLDLGCGAGMDSLIAARRTGVGGKVIGIDFSRTMISRARQAATEAGVGNVEFRIADAEELPVDSGFIDVAIVNGIFNLNPRRDDIFRELARVVRPGGSVYAAELILKGTLPPDILDSEPDWFA